MVGVWEGLNLGSIPNFFLCFGMHPKIIDVHPKLIPKGGVVQFCRQLLFYCLFFAVECLLQKGGKSEVPLQYLGPRGYAERSGAIFKQSSLSSLFEVTILLMNENRQLP